MDPRRRGLLGCIATTFLAGCLGDGNGGGQTTTTRSTTEPTTSSPTTESKTSEPTTTTPSTESCDPSSASRPPIVRDSNHPPQGYGTKPTELTPLSVADYLSDFETAFAWNRILQENDEVNSLGVNTVDGYQPDTVDGGFLASSRIEIHYTVGEDHELTEREYVTNYFVSEGPVYRVETDTDPVDPRTHPDRQLVQCGPE